MPKDKLLFKYQGDGSEFLNRIPARDLHESDRAALTDEDLALLAASPLYEARNDAPADAEKAAKRAAKAPEPVAEAPFISEPPPAPAEPKKP